MHDPLHVLEYEPIHVREDLSYDEQLQQIIDRKEQVLCTKVISFVKVLWCNHLDKEAAWERENEMKEKYSQLSKAKVHIEFRGLNTF